MSNFNLQHYFNYSKSNLNILTKNVYVFAVDEKLSDSRSEQCKDGYHSFHILKQFDKAFGENETTHLSHKTLKDEFMRTSRACNIDLAPKILFSQSKSVDQLIRAGCATYLEFQNVSDNFFFSQENQTFVRIPFSKAEIFQNSSLSFKEKRQLVRVIQFCLSGYDKLSNKEISLRQINSTHINERMDVELSESEFKLLCDYKDKPIIQFLEQALGIGKHLQDILLYAIGCFNNNQQADAVQAEQVDTFSFFERIQRYLRSIGYYGDSPMLSCVYGSSEYAQGFSRTGSIFGNVYIVNSEVDISRCNFEQDPNDPSKKTFTSIEYSYNPTPLRPKKGILIGSDYQEWFLKQANIQLDASQVKTTSCVRLTVLTYQPLVQDLSVNIATFVYPPGTFTVAEQGNVTNRHPIRVFQMNSSLMACPRNMFLIMAIMQLDD